MLFRSDLTNLNKACPQDPFPLPRIDQIVDSTAECDLLCFLDAFSGYHQIKMAVEDVEKTAFLTPCGVYCYTCMPFRLRKRRGDPSAADAPNLVEHPVYFVSMVLRDARARERILRACFVEVGEVDTHALLPSLLWHNDRVGQPIRVSDLANDPSGF